LRVSVVINNYTSILEILQATAVTKLFNNLRQNKLSEIVLPIQEKTRDGGKRLQPIADQSNKDLIK